MRRFGTVGVTAVALFIGAVCWAGDSEDQKKLQGTWDLTSVAFGGKEIPGGGKDKMVSVTFSGNKLTFKEGDKEEPGTFKLDATKKPKQIDLTKGKDSKDDAQAIYSLEGDTLKIGLGFSLKKEEKAPRPPNFDDPGCITLTFKKAKK